MCGEWNVYFLGAILCQKSRKTENRVVPWFPIRHPIRHTEMSEEDHHCCEKEDCSGGCDKHHSDDGEHHEEDHDERYECVVCDRTYVKIFFS